jgi:biopolymer transport protein TolR
VVLLIIFMVTAPMMTEGREVDLPKTQTVSVLPKEQESLILTIKADGSLFMDKYAVPIDDLGSHVRNLVTDQNKMLFLRADASVPYGTVVKVMGVLRGAGVDKLGVVAEEAKPDAPVKSTAG